MTFLAFCQWLAHTPVGITMRDSTWDFAIVEMGHLLALAIFGGSVLLVDLRFLNFGLTTQPIAKVARELLPLTAGGVIAMSISGFLMMANGPVRYYYNPAFRLKIWLFLIALVFHFVLQISMARPGREPGPSPRWLKLGSAFSLCLWLSIGIAGRAIGYV